MVPIPETVQALDSLDPDEELDMLAQLVLLANVAQETVPDLVGVSIARLEHGLTFTVVATAAEIAVLDAIQYLAGGPCVDAAHIDQPVSFDNDDAMDEDRWSLFAQTTAAYTVRTTLTLPIRVHGHTVGTVNLYAASKRAFVGHHDQLAEIFGAWAAGAVANADLAFTTRREAQVAPYLLEQRLAIDVAVGLTAGDHGISVVAAEALLRDAASRAGVSLSHLAQEIVGANNNEQDQDGRPV
jgi:GAF domain-containing protein